MPVLNRDEFFTKIRERIGTDGSEEATLFLEDMTDTYNDLESRANNSGGEWERKYHELDESWRNRYRHRFFNGGSTDVIDYREDSKDEDEYDPEEVTIDSLFNEKK